MDPLLSLFGNDLDTDEEDLMGDNGIDMSGKTLLSGSDCLPPECEEGNVEYKLKLINPSKYRFEHLVTQMKWRLREGHGEAIYEIGVEDKGLLIGLSDDEVNASMQTLYLMAEKLGATLTVLRERIITGDENSKIYKYTDCQQKCRKAIEVLVRKVPDDQQTIELRIAVLGNVETGKSTLLGVLTQGELDNGRGSARLNLFRHRHEIQTGRTSSISKEILGFDNKGVPITYNIPVRVESEDDVITYGSRLTTDHIIPIFTVSCVSGQGLDLLYRFLYVLPPSMTVKDRERLIQSDVEFQVDETFQVPEVGQ
ncbi:unnamed protein product [Medioppia subpectinata]|uniref:Uncharacterized protein n=1 Tax=Medioppia subpectinata TaxID=1979941 RepID=A0A7R9L3Z0_9ACAR|nr:unnamed protein product [Medioppia subpectinata]CAG2114884.1 unnamed protein product [Medioppia subpectinata]